VSLFCISSTWAIWGEGGGWREGERGRRSKREERVRGRRGKRE